MKRFGKNGLHKRSSWKFDLPASRSAPLKFIPDTLAWEYTEAELPFVMFIHADKAGHFSEMFKWCREQFGAELLREQRRSKRDSLEFLTSVVTRKQFGTRFDPKRMYSVSGGALWQGWASMDKPVVEAFTYLPDRGSYWFFRTASQCIAFKLRWY